MHWRPTVASPATLLAITRMAANRVLERENPMDHSNLFHEALVKIHDIAKPRPRDPAAWDEVLTIVAAALAEARSLDGQAPR
jgi:hypothetical protein